MIQWASGIAGRCAVRPKQRNSAPPNGEGTEKMSEQDRRLRAADGSPTRLNLSNNQKASLISFLHTLTDRAFLTDPRFADPFSR